MTQIDLRHGDCLDVLRSLPDASVDAVVTDGPYGLAFMGKRWDYDVPSVEIWAECLRVLKPGGHLLAFAGTRTQHRMAVRIEDAGFEIRDMIAWVYSTGFPKSLNFGCKCGRGALPYDHANQPTTKHNLSRLRVADVPQTSPTATGQGQVLLSRVSQHGASKLRQARPEPEVAGSIEPCMEGGRDVLAQEGQLQADQVRSMPSRVPSDGAEGWLHHGTSLDHGSVDRAVPDAHRGRASSQPRPARQPAVQLGTVPEQRRTQTRGMAPPEVCQVCGGLTDWQGWGTALKPAMEMITVARKPLSGTVASNVLEWGTGAINVDGCRVGGGEDKGRWPVTQRRHNDVAWTVQPVETDASKGRWPANLIHDGSDEVVALFPQSTSGANPTRRGGMGYHGAEGQDSCDAPRGAESGSAARFFYCAKASKRDRDEGLEGFAIRSAGEVTGGRKDGSAGLQSPRAGAGRTNGARNIHPTVKPADLMRYLCRLVTPPGGLVLDPFMGSGSTGKAAVLEGFRFIGIEREAEYVEIARARIEAVTPATEEPTKAPALDDAQLSLWDAP